MNRLTEKRKEPLTTKWKDVPTSYYKIKGDNTGVCISEIPRLNKLGKLEDLMEKYELNSIEELEEIIKDYDDMCKDMVEFGFKKFGYDIELEKEDKTE